MRQTADVIIIGAGIQGSALAYYLAKMGTKNILVLEKGSICSGATGRCGAGFRAQWGTEMNCRLGLACVERFEGLKEELGMDIGLSQEGYLMVAYQQHEFDQLVKNVELQNRIGVDTRVVSYAEAREICPGLAADDAVGFTFNHRDGHVDPFLTTFAYTEAAKRLGVEFETFTQVTDIRYANGKVYGVVTDKGHVDAPVVVSAVGAWTQNLLKKVGVELPLFSERHEILITEPVEAGVCPPMLMSFSGNYYIQQRPHGSIIAGCSPEGHPEDYKMGSSWQFLELMSNKLVKLLPRTRHIRVVRQWAGLYNMSPDRQPVVGECEEVQGIFLTCGFSGHGFMFGPVTGELLAEQILGRKPHIAIDMLHYRRFARGELIREPAVV